MARAGRCPVLQVSQDQSSHSPVNLSTQLKSSEGTVNHNRNTQRVRMENTAVKQWWQGVPRCNTECREISLVISTSLSFLPVRKTLVDSAVSWTSYVAPLLQSRNHFRTWRARLIFRVCKFLTVPARNYCYLYWIVDFGVQRKREAGGSSLKEFYHQKQQ